MLAPGSLVQFREAARPACHADPATFPAALACAISPATGPQMSAFARRLRREAEPDPCRVRSKIARGGSPERKPPAAGGLRQGDSFLRGQS